jgi:hypothetical protein
MNTSMTTWMLGGALVASLAWNAVHWSGARNAPSAPTAASAGCAMSLDVGRLALDDTQRDALRRWSAELCGPACELDAAAEASWQTWIATLRDPKADPQQLRRLAAEVSRARARSLEACVDSILAVRGVLEPAQLASLMECCGSTCGGL